MSRITWYGHSAFKIEAGGVSVIIDPFFSPSSGQKWEFVGKVDLVLLTHDHGDHVGDAVAICKTMDAMLGCMVGTANRMRAEGVPESQIFNGIGFNIGGTLECKGIKALMVQAFHSSDTGEPAGYIITMPDGLVVYHAGDTGIFESMGMLAKLYPLDLALLPIGGIFTMDAYQAANACKLLKASNVIPMHWGTFPVLAQSPEPFKEAAARIAPETKVLSIEIGGTLELNHSE